jgi:hypothetical protein
MRTEDFDDALRRKIESVNSSYEQEDVDRVHSYVNQQRAARSGRKYFLMGVWPLISLIILGLLTWNILQFKKQAELENTILALKANFAKSRNENNSGKISAGYKYSEENNSKNISNKDNEKTNQSNLGLHTDAADKSNLNESTKDINVQNKNKLLTDHQKLRGAVLTNNIGEKNELPGNQIEKTDSFLMEKGISNKAAEKINDPSEQHLQAANSIDPSNISKDSLTAVLANKSVVKTDSSLLSQNTLSLPGKNTADQADGNSKGNERPVLLVKNWNYRAGPGFEIANSQLGFSVIGEGLYKKHWGVTLGLKYLSIENERFEDEDDYQNRKNKDFKNSYKQHVNDSDQHNIRINNAIFQIPVSLSYYHMMKKNFSLVLGAGTDIDLLAKQHVEYRHQITISDYVGKKFDIVYTNQFFNNIVLSAGIQKQLKPLLVQLSPFMSPQLRQVVYKKESFYYGIRLRVLYSF